jgi:hypothetical protein
MKGMGSHPYNEEFVKIHRTSMTLLKDLGYGRSYVEERIGIELEVLVENIRELDGRHFDPKDMLFQFSNGIMMSFMFGRQFDYNDPLVQQINTHLALAIAALQPALNLFPVLTYLPKYSRLLDTIIACQK